MKRLAFLTAAAALTVSAGVAFAGAPPTSASPKTPALASYKQPAMPRLAVPLPTRAQLAQEHQMTSGMMLNEVRTLWRQQDGAYENG